MARTVFVNGESMVYVKGAAGTNIANISELGLSDNPIAITLNPRHKDVNLDAWGEAPMDVQWKLMDVQISIPLLQFDLAVLKECVRLSMGGANAAGRMGRAGTLLGNGLGRFVAGNKYVGLNIASPVGQNPWRFYFAYLVAPMTFPTGTEKTTVRTEWRAIPYTTDPWQAGAGALNYPIFDFTLDS